MSREHDEPYVVLVHSCEQARGTRSPPHPREHRTQVRTRRAAPAEIRRSDRGFARTSLAGHVWVNECRISAVQAKMAGVYADLKKIGRGRVAVAAE